MRRSSILGAMSKCALAGMILTVSLSATAFGARDTRGYAPLRQVVRPTSVAISPLVSPGDLVIKFREGASIDSKSSRLGGPDARRVVELLASRGLSQLAPSISGDVATIRGRRQTGEDRVKMILPDLSLYFRHPVSDPPLVSQLVRELNALDEVEVAYFAPHPEPASLSSSAVSHPADAYSTSTTPNFQGGQLYLSAAPGGVDAYAAWTLPGGTGAGTQIIDVEYGWQLTHEDLSAGQTAIVIGVNPDGHDHGTAVLGEMVADHNGYGMTGIAYDADIGVSSVWTMSTASAITLAAAASDPGDAILIELHSPGPRFNYVDREDQRGFIAMEFWQDNFDAMLNAWAQGVIVCEAAGNGAEDFDDPIYGGAFDPAVRYSHAIICGAGNPPNATANDRSKLGFSNWGQRVDLQGYGTLVYTCGYGDLYSTGGEDFWYTAGFGGTSSASPIVTGTVLAVSGVFQNLFGIVPDADTIRNLLVATGSPQQGPSLSRHIGPRPDLHAALGTLFDPIDSIWYGDITAHQGNHLAIPVMLSNSHPVRDIILPFMVNSGGSIVLDSATRGSRTGYFEQVAIAYDNRPNGQVGYLLRADNGGGSPYLPQGSGVVANLWFSVIGGMPGQVYPVDSAWLGSSTRLRLVSAFDDGYPDYFKAGSITIKAPCNCQYHGDANDDGSVDVSDVVKVIDVAFRGGLPAPTDPDCLHATRADYNCDGVIDVIDVIRAIDYSFRGGAPICDPCNH